MSITSDTGPFALVPEWVLDLEITDRALRLYGLLAIYADRNGNANPARRTLAARLRCSEASLDRARAELEKVGAITVERRRDAAGDWTANEYRICRVNPTVGVLTGEDTPAAKVSPPVRTRVLTGDERTRSSSVVGSVSALSPRPTSSDSTLAPTGATRKPDLIWDAVVEAMGHKPATSSERGAWNRAVGDMRKAGWTPDDVALVAKAHRELWRDRTLTPTSMARHGAELISHMRRRVEHVEGVASVLGINPNLLNGDTRGIR